MVTIADREFDTDSEKRESEKAFFGYVLRHALTNALQMATQGIAVISYVAARMLAFGGFIAACLQTPWTAVKCAPLLWVSAESVALGMLRSRDGNWEFYDRNLSGWLSDYFLHGIVYVGLVAAPFPILRNPAFLGPHLYRNGCGIVLALNFPLVALSYHAIGEGPAGLSEWWSWAILLGLNLVIGLSAAIFMWCVPANYKSTFYKVGCGGDDPEVKCCDPEQTHAPHSLLQRTRTTSTHPHRRPDPPLSPCSTFT